MYRCIVAALCLLPASLHAEDLGTHGYAKSGDLKIHYVTAGEGPLLIMLHGFPDFWYSWRHQMPALAQHYQVVAMDQRGYNKSGQPKEVDQYRVEKLVGDVAAVIDHFGKQRATIVGHDWGGFVAWSFAMMQPDRTEKLIVLNLPHPWGLRRELATNPDQAKNSQYARDFQRPGAEALLTPEALAAWVTDPEPRKAYVSAFARSSIPGMLAYYRANYPRPPYEKPEDTPPPVSCPVLAIHGLKDQYLLSSGLNDNWKWVKHHYTLVTIPDAGHFVQHEKPELVTQTILGWLKRPDPR